MSSLAMWQGRSRVTAAALLVMLPGCNPAPTSTEGSVEPAEIAELPEIAVSAEIAPEECFVTQTVSLLGEPLQALPLSEAEQTVREADVAAALAQLQETPTSETAAIWLGRRQAYLGDYRDAIATYTNALQLHPDSYRLLRHRGHRWITLRSFDRAQADLSLAWELAKSQPNQIEPDGIPTPGVPPRSTDHGNILYHLGLAHYLTGNFIAAAQTFAQEVELASNDDTLVASTYWLYLSWQRAGQPALAQEALARIKSDAEGGMDVRENQSYYRLLLFYRGVLPREALKPVDGPLGLGVDEATIGYGLSMPLLLAGDQMAAAEMWKTVVESTNWPAFGHIAAEVDLARMRGESR